VPLLENATPEFVATVPGRSVPETYAVLPLAGQVQGVTTTAVTVSAVEENTTQAEVTTPENISPIATVTSAPVNKPQSIDKSKTESVAPTKTKTTKLLIDSEVFRSALARRIHELTNIERAKDNLPALAYEDVLAQNATRYSARMQAENFLDHVDPNGCNMTCRFAADNYIAEYWGENLARWRSSYTPSLEEVATFFVREWVKSSGHRDNLLSPHFTHEGIGVAIEGNEVFVTVHFAEPI
jgi:uncharacterized protein YkwD